MAEVTNKLVDIGKVDKLYNGVVIDLQRHEIPTQQFEFLLPQAVAKWQSDKRRGIHIMIPITQSELIPIAVRNQFTFHHSHPSYLKLVRWLPVDEPNLLPGYATHYIGVGGVVVNNNNEVLAVREKFHLLPGQPINWKFPGGHANAGESIVTAGIREVLEETGIKCEFRSLLCFRHTFNYKYGCDDLYYIIWYHALTHDITSDPHEIAECKWIPIAEYVAMLTDTTRLNRYAVECYIKLQEKGTSGRGGIDMFHMPHPVPARGTTDVYGFVPLWPLFAQVLEKYQLESRVTERACRSLRFMLRCVQTSVPEVLPPLITIILNLFTTNKHSCFLYLGSIIIDEYGGVTQCHQILTEMFTTFVHPCFEVFSEEKGIINSPDTVDDFFRLCGR
ncbi:hypothetical protein LOD99_15815 [Oopsacas minuta]|uniref:Nudix hydrolase domain-containing protein n=1 Tax=Oopsacas minuta TaxID=111878 RepID=A0AAV7K9S3_9METZ|nr:hypothetical protein LOD99_15815 [Oopsacas minuta]